MGELSVVLLLVEAAVLAVVGVVAFLVVGVRALRRWRRDRVIRAALAEQTAAFLPAGERKAKLDALWEQRVRPAIDAERREAERQEQDVLATLGASTATTTTANSTTSVTFLAGDLKALEDAPSSLARCACGARFESALCFGASECAACRPRNHEDWLAARGLVESPRKPNPASAVDTCAECARFAFFGGAPCACRGSR